MFIYLTSTDAAIACKLMDLLMAFVNLEIAQDVIGRLLVEVCAYLSYDVTNYLSYGDTNYFSL